MSWGVILIITGSVWYIIHAVIYNYYLKKNTPELFEHQTTPSGSKHKKIKVFITEGGTPAWVALLGVPPIPLLLFGLLITVVSFVFSLFR